MHIKKWIKYTLSFVALLQLSSFSFAEDYMMGRWCDSLGTEGMDDDVLITIVWTDNEEYEARYSTLNGVQDSELLSLLPGDVYVKQGNVYAERLKVHKKSGNLQLMDNEGVVRTFIKLENEPQEGECFKN